MKGSQRLGIVLGVANLVLFAVLMLNDRSARAQDTTPVVRGRGLELVDAAGRVRAQLDVEPDGACGA